MPRNRTSRFRLGAGSRLRRWPTASWNDSPTALPSSPTAAWASSSRAPPPRMRIPEEANLRAPETVVKLHVGFIQAGADLIETNTFGANRRKLAASYLEDQLQEINSTGVKLAREAREMSGRDVFIAGSIGPLGEGGVAQRTNAWRSSPSRPQCSKAAASTSSRSRPSSSSTSSSPRSRQSAASPRCPSSRCSRSTRAPRRSPASPAQEAAERLHELGVAAIGANHGAGIQAALAALNEMGGNGLPLAAMPNIGLASMAGNRIIYPHASPEYFAEFAAHARNLGARVIGGCCGTTPTEIAAIASAVKEERQPSAPARLRRARGPSRRARATRGDRPRPRISRERVGRLRSDRPAARRQLRRDDRGRARDQGLRECGLGRHQRQRDRACRGQRAHARGRDRAQRGRRDDPAHDDPRRDDHGARVAAPRRARVRNPQRPLRSPATRPRSATIPARAASTRSTPSASPG